MIAKYCVQCGLQLLNTVLLCPRDGNRTFALYAPQTLPAPPSSSIIPAPKYCVTCDYKVSDRTLICPRCGNTTFNALRSRKIWEQVYDLISGSVGIKAIAAILIIALAGLLFWSIGDTTKAEEYFAKGNKLFDAQDYDSSYEAYSLAIRWNRKNALYYLARGNLLIVKLEYDRAKADYEEALALNPEFGPAYFSRGTLAWLLGDLPEAKSYYQKAVNLQPDYQFYYFQLIRVMEELQESKEVIEKVYRDAYLQDQTRQWASAGIFSAMYARKAYDTLLKEVENFESQGRKPAIMYYYASRIYYNRMKKAFENQNIEEARNNAFSSLNNSERAIRLDPDNQNVPIDAYAQAVRLSQVMQSQNDCSRYLRELEKRTGRPQNRNICEF